jgi:autotransporter translocation and assembly factor TamB
MKQMAIKTIKRTGHAILDLAAILLVLVILVHVSLAVAAVWFNTPSGQDMLRRNIDTALAESGYTLHFKSLSYNPLDGVVVTNLNMGDGAGPILSADQFRCGSVCCPLRRVRVRSMCMAGMSRCTGCQKEQMRQSQ